MSLVIKRSANVNIREAIVESAVIDLREAIKESTMVDTRSPFLALPAALRNTVYELVVGRCTAAVFEGSAVTAPQSALALTRH